MPMDVAFCLKMECLPLLPPSPLKSPSLQHQPIAPAPTRIRSSSLKPLAAQQRRSSLSIRTSKSTTTLTPTTTPAALPPKKKVLVPIGFGTEVMEAVILVGVLRRAGADVLVASVESQLEIEASSGTRLVADTCISTCSNDIFDLIALPGGMPGSARLRDCEILRKITCKQAEEKRLYGAICAAPAVTLQPWGLLKRKQTTCHPAFMDKLPTFWAVKSNNQVSGELTTSRGPGTAFEFALSLVEQLFGESTAKEVEGTLLFHAHEDNPRKEEFNKIEWSVDHIPHVLIPVANGTEEIEVVTVVDILRRAKVDVVIASVEKSVQIVGSQDTRIVADKTIDSVADSIYDLIILPDLKIGKKIGGGHEAGGLYYLDGGGSSVALQTSLTHLQWHCRLGHPSFKALKILVPSLSHLSSLQCESCQYGKHHRVSFSPRVDSRMLSPFVLIHSDVWSPIKIVL